MRVQLHILGVLFFLIAMVSCKTKEVSKTSSVSQQDEELIAVKDPLLKQFPEGNVIVEVVTTPCFGQCPVFDFHVEENGRAYFNGKRFVEFEGKYTTKLTDDQLNLIFKKAKKIDFFELESVYDEENVMDLPATYVFLRKGDQSKKIKARYNVPEDLKSYNRWLVDWIQTLQWTPVE